MRRVCNAADVDVGSILTQWLQNQGLRGQDNHAAVVIGYLRCLDPPGITSFSAN
jgi:hypothetical protein